MGIKGIVNVFIFGVIAFAMALPKEDPNSKGFWGWAYTPPIPIGGPVAAPAPAATPASPPPASPASPPPASPPPASPASPPPASPPPAAAAASPPASPTIQLVPLGSLLFG